MEVIVSPQLSVLFAALETVAKYLVSTVILLLHKNIQIKVNEKSVQPPS